MLAPQRQQIILQTLDASGGVRVTDLALRFSVTEETVRRDLEKLEAQNKLLRTHGGALPLEDDIRRPVPYAVRETQRVEEKIEIARMALGYIQEGDTLFVDASSTVFQLVRLLPDIDITVICHSLPVIDELRSRSQIHVICTGGTLDLESQAFIGPQAEEAISAYQTHKCFISCKGFDGVRGLSEAIQSHASLKKKVLSWSDHAYLLLDHSKFDTHSSYYFAAPQEVDDILTDAQTDPAILQSLREMGLGMKVAKAGESP